MPSERLRGPDPSTVADAAHSTPAEAGGRRIYFVGPERADAYEKLRREKQFTVDIRNRG